MSLKAKILGTPNDDLVTWRDPKKDQPPKGVEVLCKGVVRAGEYNPSNVHGCFVAFREPIHSNEHRFRNRFGFSANGLIVEVYQWRPIEPLLGKSED